MRVTRIQNIGVFADMQSGRALLRIAGDLALIKRGSLRSVIMRCPCGCGDDLVLNLDFRAGPAWYLYQDEQGLTVYPSYWRKDKCESHFIVWNDEILWCGFHDHRKADESKLTQEDLRVQSLLDSLHYKHFFEIAVELDSIPWRILESCKKLKRFGVAVSDESGRFKLR
jgi:hypothetical protein